MILKAAPNRLAHLGRLLLFFLLPSLSHPIFLRPDIGGKCMGEVVGRVLSPDLSPFDVSIYNLTGVLGGP